jgi:tetratricopeptide (TPR) repeat protein
MVLGHSYSAIKKYEEAIHEYYKALKREPTNLFAHMGLAVAYINKGMANEAHEIVAKIYRLEPNFSLENYPNPHVNSEVVRDWFDALRKAGLS